MGYRKRPDRKTFRYPEDILQYVDGREFRYIREIPTNFEGMSDDGDPANKSKYKPVDHVRWMMTQSNVGHSQDYDQEGSPPNHSFDKVSDLYFHSRFDPELAFQATLRGLATDWIAKQRPLDWDIVAAKGIPSLRNAFNTINFLAELDDIPSILKSLRKNAKNLRDHRQDLVTLRGFRPDLLIGDLATLVTDGILTYNLGIIPLLYDAQDLIEMVSATLNKGHKRAKLIDRYIRQIERGIRCTSFWGYIPVDIEIEGLRTFGRGTVRYRLTGSIELRATALVVGKVPNGNPLARFLDSVGVYPDLHTLWNAVPFSFLVDYIAPIGDILESEYGSWAWQTAGDWRAGLRVLDAMWSAKFEGSWAYEEWRNSTPESINSSSPDPISYPGVGFHKDVSPYAATGTYSWFFRQIVPDAQIDGNDVTASVHLPRVDQHQANIGALLLQPFAGIFRKHHVTNRYRSAQYRVDRMHGEKRKRLLGKVVRKNRPRLKRK